MLVSSLFLTTQNLYQQPMSNFIKVNESSCTCCDEDITMYTIPLPSDAVSYNFMDGFSLELDESEFMVLYLAMKEHLTGLADVQPVTNDED